MPDESFPLPIGRDTADLQRFNPLGSPNKGYLIPCSEPKEAFVSSRFTRQLFAALCLGGISALAAGCGSSSSGSLTLYSAQHEPITEAFAKGFEEENGAKVQIRYGEDEGLASQIEQEGDAS